jgi:hypothetical protein
MRRCRYCHQEIPADLTGRRQFHPVCRDHASYERVVARRIDRQIEAHLRAEREARRRRGCA